MQNMKSYELRELFLKFFEEKGCLIHPSDSLTPNDPTLLFTSAGMVQFKPYFTGERVPPKTRMTTSQKCLRTGDLDIVGTTPFHHTFFEMLGNFSFGDYFKEEAITWAWEFITERLKIPGDRIWVSVYQTDDEAAEIWEKKIGIPANHIVRMGEKSNYWPSNAPSEGPNGPCGPCSEIFYDFGEDVGCCKPECDPDCDCARFSEIWNLVFMQFNREEGGKLTPLPRKNIDTGMGLERVTAILQGTPTNFETDLFMPILSRISEISGVKYGATDGPSDVAMRVIADHSRAMVFAISDGVMPSNVGRGYVLRRVIRRAVLKGRSLGVKELFLDSLTPVVIEIMKGQYPELVEREGHVCRTIKSEEEKFSRTLDMGLQKLEEVIERLSGHGAVEVPGAEAFVLYDTYGFPMELTQEIAAERGLTVDTDSFEDAMKEQRRMARAGSDIATELFSGSLSALTEIERSEPATEFVGYGCFSAGARIVGILNAGELVDSASAGDKVDVVLDRTPFYAEMGGQVSDIGTLTQDGSVVKVEHVSKVGGLYVHSGVVQSGSISADSPVVAELDAEYRRAIMRNHTATHLLHKALQTVLGDHVVQAGSSVDPDRLRFDFTQNTAIPTDDLARIEEIVNEEILNDDDVDIVEMSLEEARSGGAMALFSEKYAGVVRVVSVGDFSKELCGGTHVGRTAQIGSFKILSEGSVAAGVRRIEAVTGMGAYKYMHEREGLLATVAEMLRTNAAEVPSSLTRLMESLRAAEKEIEALKQKTASGQADELAAQAVECNGVKIIAARVEGGDLDIMSSLADSLAQKLGSAVIALASPSNEKVLFVVEVTADLVKRGFNAGNIVREAAKVAGGGGGGRPDFAQAGGRDATKLDEALSKVREVVEQQAKA